MSITVNGEPRNLPPGGTVTDLAAALGLPGSGIAIAVDGAVVPRGAWGTMLADGAVVEVVTAVQGG
ncbi:MAG: sulfur carrier protein ThiS [Gordonia sp. (in: high G+C Gram-positive bacteria)]